jgi:flagellar biosynthesis protein FliR
VTQPKGFRTANKRYHYTFWPLMGVYVVAIFAASSFIDENTAPMWLKVSGALAVALPVLGVLWVMLRQVGETDEYTRLRQLNALARGGAITAGAAFVVGFLQIFGAIGPVDVFWFGPLFFIAYGLSHCIQHFGATV